MWGDDWGTMIWGGAMVPLMSPLGLVALTACFLAGGYLMQTRARRRGASLLAMTTLAAVPLTALASVTLPHTFVEGTIADADQVNANFAAIQGDFAKYHVTLDASNFGTSVPVPAMVLDQLCRDEDGCTLRVISRNRNGLGSAPFVAAPVHFDYQTLEAPGAPGTFWWYSTDINAQAAVDGDGIPRYIARVDNDCFIHDGEFVNQMASDSVAGINLLVWFGTSNPDRSCEFTIID